MRITLGGFPIAPQTPFGEMACVHPFKYTIMLGAFRSPPDPFGERLLSFQGSDHNPFDEELLDEGVGAEDGQGGDENTGGLQPL